MSHSQDRDQGNSTRSPGGPVPPGTATSASEAHQTQLASVHPHEPGKTLHRLLSLLFESKFAILLWGTVAGSILVPYIQRHAEERQHRLTTAQSVLSQVSAYTNLSWEEYQLVLPFNVDRTISKDEYRAVWNKIMEVKLRRYNSLGSLKSMLVLLGRADQTDPIKDQLDQYARTLNQISDRIVASLGYFFCKSNPCADDDQNSWERDDEPDFNAIEASISSLDAQESQIYADIQKLISR